MTKTMLAAPTLSWISLPTHTQTHTVLYTTVEPPFQTNQDNIDNTDIHFNCLYIIKHEEGKGTEMPHQNTVSCLNRPLVVQVQLYFPGTMMNASWSLCLDSLYLPACPVWCTCASAVHVPVLSCIIHCSHTQYIIINLFTYSLFFQKKDLLSLLHNIRDIMR